MQTLKRPRIRAARRYSWLSSPYVVIAATTLIFWVLSSIALLIYTAEARAATTHELLIPSGTAEKLSRGDNPLELPSTWDYYAGDVLLVDNRDTVLHQIGSWYIAPGSIFAVELQPALSGSFTCSLYPTGVISLDVQPRSYDMQMTLFPTFLGGPVVGLIIVGIRRMMRALDDPDEER